MLELLTGFFVFLLYFSILVVVCFLFYLNELLRASSSSSCPLCKKNKAREIISIPRFNHKMLLKMETAIHFKCKYCGHKWSKELDWDRWGSGLSLLN